MSMSRLSSGNEVLANGRAQIALNEYSWTGFLACILGSQNVAYASHVIMPVLLRKSCSLLGTSAGPAG